MSEDRKPILDAKEHRRRHAVLHNGLDELAADFMACTGKLLSKTNVMDLMKWSYSQTKEPTERKP